MCSERLQTVHPATVRQRLDVEEGPHMPNPALQVDWLKLSHGCTMVTRVSYGIKAQGSVQNAERLR